MNEYEVTIVTSQDIPAQVLAEHIVNSLDDLQFLEPQEVRVSHPFANKNNVRFDDTPANAAELFKARSLSPGVETQVPGDAIRDMEYPARFADGGYVETPYGEEARRSRADREQCCGICPDDAIEAAFPYLSAALRGVRGNRGA